MRSALSLAPALAVVLASTLAAGAPPADAPPAPAVRTGRAAMGDWTTDAPGVRRKLTPDDPPAPYATPSADNGAAVARRPPGALPRVPDGFVVDLLTTKVSEPRMIRTAP